MPIKTNKIESEKAVSEVPTTAIIDPENKSFSQRSKCQKWLMLFMICNAIMGKYYCEDMPGVLEPQLKSLLNIGH